MPTTFPHIYLTYYSFEVSSNKELLPICANASIKNAYDAHQVLEHEVFWSAPYSLENGKLRVNYLTATKYVYTKSNLNLVARARMMELSDFNEQPIKCHDIDSSNLKYSHVSLKSLVEEKFADQLHNHTVESWKTVEDKVNIIIKNENCIFLDKDTPREHFIDDINGSNENSDISLQGLTAAVEE